MQIPKRRAQMLKTQGDDDGANHLTAAGLARLKRELADLERQQPEAIDDVNRLAQLGDFSENAEYQDAKFRLRRINDRIFSIKDRLIRAVVITSDAQHTGKIGLGSTVTVRGQPHPIRCTSDVPLLRKEREREKERELVFQIVGPRESNPSRGRISHLSPLGSALMNHSAGESVTVQTENGEMEYGIVEVR